MVAADWVLVGRRLVFGCPSLRAKERGAEAEAPSSNGRASGGRRTQEVRCRPQASHSTLRAAIVPESDLGTVRRSAGSCELQHTHSRHALHHAGRRRAAIWFELVALSALGHERRCEVTCTLRCCEPLLACTLGSINS